MIYSFSTYIYGKHRFISKSILEIKSNSIIYYEIIINPNIYTIFYIDSCMYAL
jgi:hypothetical protein